MLNIVGYKIKIAKIILLVASVTVSCSVYFKKESTIRLISFIGLSFWVTNGIINSLYFALASDSISLLSIIIAFFRLDIGNRKEKN